MREKTHAESAEAPDAVRLRRLVWLGSLVMCLHTGTSYLEEVLFKRLAFTSAFFMVLVMCVIYVGGYLVARAWASRGGRNGARRPLFEMGDSRSERLTMGALCLAYVGSNALSKLSLNYVTVPMMYVCVCVCAWVRQSVRACAAAGWRARWRAFQTREEARVGAGAPARNSASRLRVRACVSDGGHAQDRLQVVQTHRCHGRQHAHCRESVLAL